jgi:hypothetical protein
VSYHVVAPLVIAKDQDGRLHHVYEGGVIAWLSDEQAEHFVSSGLVVERIGGSAPAAGEPADEGGKPADDAQKSELIEWLVKNALDEDGNDYTKSKLNPLNKAALWDLINAVGDSDADPDGSEG